MEQFKSSEDYYHFAQAVKHKSRYIQEQQTRDFLAAVAATVHKREEVIEKYSILCRAQRGFAWGKEYAGQEEEFEVPDAYPPERMVPKAEFVGDGRVNPRGIPCLYLASTQDTAMAEVRPWVGSHISMAQFKVMRDVKLVDCSKDKRIFAHWVLDKKSKPSAEKCEEIVWGDIAYAFSRPVTPDEPVTEYVPTQILAELFRSCGYDGVVYWSLLAEGHNIALFDCGAAELINCTLFETDSVSFKFDQCNNTYFISKHYPQQQKKNEAAEATKKSE